jgi:hypothetical protein
MLYGITPRLDEQPGARLTAPAEARKMVMLYVRSWAEGKMVTLYASHCEWQGTVPNP